MEGCLTGHGQFRDPSVHLGRDLAARLGGIVVERNAMLVRDGSAFRDWLDRSGPVVGMHDADKRRLGRDRSPKAVGIDET